MIIIIEDRWAFEYENREEIIGCIEVPDEKGIEVMEYIFNYEHNAEDGEYTYEDMLAKLEEKFEVNINTKTKVAEVLF